MAPFGYLLGVLRDKPALVIAIGKEAAFQRTPANTFFLAFQTFKINATLNDSGTLDGKIERTMRGDLEILMRAGFRRVPQSQWKDVMQQISYGSGFAGEVSDVSASAPENTDAPFRFACTYHRKNYPYWKDYHLHRLLPAIILPRSQR